MQGRGYGRSSFKKLGSGPLRVKAREQEAEGDVGMMILKTEKPVRETGKVRQLGDKKWEQRGK